MKFLRITLLCFLLVGVSVDGRTQQIGLSLPPDSSKAVIPYKNHNNLIVIPVNINGRAVLSFIVDSSIQETILTEKSVGDALGLNYSTKIPMGQTGTGTNFGYAANELNLELSGGVMSGDNHSILVLEQDFLELSNLAQVPIHGLIGKDIFERFVVEVDQARQVLVLHDPPSFSAPSGYETIPVKLEDGRPYVKVESIFENWDELSEYMLLKTGAPHAVLFDSNQNIFFVPPRKIETILGTSGSGDIGAYIGRVREVKIGELAFENPIASFTKEQAKGDNRGSIGMGLLSRLNIIIDFPGKRLLAKPNREFSKEFEYDLSGIKIDIEGEQFFIQYVQKGSPAEKVGIKVGDQLTAVNGEKLTSENLSKVLSIFSVKPDKKVTLTFLLDGTEKEVSFKLTRFI